MVVPGAINRMIGIRLQSVRSCSFNCLQGGLGVSGPTRRCYLVSLSEPPPRVVFLETTRQ